MTKYIHQQKNWHHFRWDDAVISVLLGQVRNMQGQIIGKMNALGFTLQEEATLATLTLDYMQPLTEERLFSWHSALFPAGRSGMYKIEVAMKVPGDFTACQIKF
jgi:hypothetical protein